LRRTYEEAMGRLDTPTPLGYSSAGEVLEAGISAHSFMPGDRVACVGQGYASHAEFVTVPVNLVAKIPDGVSFDEAAFGMLGIIALHGVRMAKLEFGGTVAVLGLGLIGLLTVQILRAYGCRVVCMDPDADKIALAVKFGAEAAVSSIEAMEDSAASLTIGFGCDAVIVTAATTSDAPIHAAVRLSRLKGRIVVVGVTDIHPDRNELWAKEVELVVSRAAGPGSLDTLYEQDGVDLPIGEVRWTLNRNLQEFLRLIETRRVDVTPLITNRFPIAEAEGAYKHLMNGTLGSPIGVLLDYACDAPIIRQTKTSYAQSRSVPTDNLRLGMVGAGLFGKAVLLPALKKVSGVSFAALSTSSGASAAHNAERFGFVEATTDADAIFESKGIDAVIVATPHDQHASAVLRAIETNKPLFLEKPLCVTTLELEEIARAISQAQIQPLLMVGHNRRYSPHTNILRKWLGERTGPLVMSVRINAGFVPREHWVHAESQGRSRIIGEMTHFLDLICTLTDARFRRVHASRVTGNDRTIINNDNLSAIFEMTDGSVATLVYSAQGARQTPREQIEIFSAGRTLMSTDFKSSALFSATGLQKSFRTSGAQSGYVEELNHFVAAVRGRTVMSPPLEILLHVMHTAFALEEALARGTPVLVDAR
jgi:predicted dehydrogenase